MDGGPALCVETPVVGGVLVAAHSNFSSLHFFVSIDTHNNIVFSFIFY